MQADKFHHEIHMIRRSQGAAPQPQGKEGYDAVVGGEAALQGSMLERKAQVEPSFTTRTLEQLQCEGEDYEKLINSKGLPHCYQCRPQTEETTKVSRVSYDYEMLYDDSGVPNGDLADDRLLPLFEFGLMDQVATEFYLRGCQMWRQENSENFTITGLSSLYLDFRDFNVDDCEFVGGDPFLKCAPVAGSMTFEYYGDATAEEVEGVVLDEIKKVMDDSRGIRGPIKSVLFLGDRQEYREGQGPNIAASTAAEDDREAVRTTSIATSASAIVFILVIVGAALFLWRNKSEKKGETIDVAPSDVECPPESVDVLTLDHEMPSTPPRNIEKVSPPLDLQESLGSSENIEEQDDDMSDAAVAESMEEPNGDQVSSVVPPPPITRTPTPPPIASFNSSGSSDDSGAGTDGVLVAAAAVPPPKDTKSETLKKHRKKKKKKYKKVTLVRVNSRENIASMETISETDEQEQQDDLDDDEDKRPNGPVATYSTSDDESDACSTASSDNEEEQEQNVVRSGSLSPIRSRRDLPPLPPVEF